MDNLINTNEINNKLIEDINYYATECQKTYKDYLENKISDSLNILKNQIDAEIKSDICRKIGTNNLYRYDEYIEKSKEYRTLLEKLIHRCDNQYDDIKNKFMANEKNQIIILHIFWQSGNFPNQYDYIFISVNSNIIRISQYNHDPCHVQIYENDFLLPTDYIKIFNMIKLDHLSIENINDTLLTIKNTLYNRKLIPLYAKDIVEENNKLKLLYDEYKEKNDIFL